jgi:hypothetical protein
MNVSTMEVMDYSFVSILQLYLIKHSYYSLVTLKKDMYA